MKPRNKREARFEEYCLNLNPLNSNVKNWAFKHIDHVGFTTKKNGTTCMECGHVFRTDKSSCKCPNCKVKLDIVKTRKKSQSNSIVFALIDTYNEYQLVIYYTMIQYLIFGKKAEYSYDIVCINALSDDDKVMTLSRNTIFSYYRMDYPWVGDLSIKNFAENKHSIYTKNIYPVMKYRNIYKQRGFEGMFFEYGPTYLFRRILSDKRVETILKRKTPIFLDAIIAQQSFLSDENIWRYVKICFRNNYIPYDIDMWLDYISMVLKYKSDISNAYYLCPADLKAEHDKWDAKIKSDRKKEQDRALFEKQLAIKQGYKILALKNKAFKGFEINDEIIRIIYLDNIKKYERVGESLDICIHSNKYWNRKNSIILIAYVDDKPQECIEVLLNPIQIKQINGYDNTPSDYQNQVKTILENNFHKINKLSSLYYGKISKLDSVQKSKINSVVGV